MIYEYKALQEAKNLILGFPLLLIFACCIGYAMYHQGYSDARMDYSQPIKYRCHEGTVYRSTQGYWENTKQACKSLEEIK
jgi:hypothetical protein